jgi:hypothetical protein
MQPPTSTTDYAQQLARGFRWLRFAPPLEAEYRAQRDASLRARVLSIGVLGLVVWCGYWVLDQLRIAPSRSGRPCRRAWRCWAQLAWASAWRSSPR